MCGGKNGTNGCHLAVLSKDIAFASDFMATSHPRSASGIAYASKKLSNLKMEGNSASYPVNIW